MRVCRTILASGALWWTGMACGQEAATQGWSFEIAGKLQTDFIGDSNRMAPDWVDAFRPSKIGVDEQYGPGGETSFSVKQSSFGINVEHPTPAGTLRIVAGMDFFGVDDNEGRTTPRLDEAYIEFSHWRAGIADTVFMDADVFPKVIDYWGPAGMAITKTTQLRYTFGTPDTERIAAALELTDIIVDPGNLVFDPTQDLSSHATIPDLTLQWRHEAGWGHVQAAAVLRRLGYEVDHSPDQSRYQSSVPGYGLNLTAVIRISAGDKVLLQAAGGRGVANYFNDGGMDVAPEGPAGNWHASAIPLLGLEAYYEHAWNSVWSSSLGWSETRVRNTDQQPGDTFHSGNYASVNLIATPTEKLLVGAEMLWGQLIEEDGACGRDLRVQVSVRYSFAHSW